MLRCLFVWMICKRGGAWGSAAELESISGRGSVPLLWSCMSTLWPDAQIRWSAVPLLYFFNFHLWKFSNKKILINYFKTFHLMASVFMFFFVDLQRVLAEIVMFRSYAKLDCALMNHTLCHLIVIFSKSKISCLQLNCVYSFSQHPYNIRFILQ